MRRIYPLVFAAIMFAACEKPEPPAIVDSSIDDKDYSFNVIYSVTDDYVEDYETEGYIYLSNDHYPDSAWNSVFSNFFCTTTTDGSYSFEIPNDKTFNINFKHEWFGGYVDTVFGSGYFDEDTLYMTYTYRNLETNKYGHVNIHSF